jgi:serine/threonine-protein kinase
MVLLPLVALMVGAAIATALFQNLANGRPSATAEAADTAHDRGVVLVAANYVDRPVDDVVAQLRSYGLDVQRRADPSASVAPGLVSRIDPVGVELVKHDVVTVFYAPAEGDSGRSGSFSGSEVAGSSGSTAPTTGVTPVTDANAAVTGAGTTREAGKSAGSGAPTSSAAPETSQPSESTAPSSAPTSSAPETSAESSSAAASPSPAGQ